MNLRASKGRIPYHHCFCALSYQPASTFLIPPASRKELTTNPSPFSLLFLSFFVKPMPLSSLQALVIPMLPYLTELCSTRLAPSFLFLCGIFAVPLPGMPSVVSVHYLCRDMVSCTSSWASSHVSPALFVPLGSF